MTKKKTDPRDNTRSPDPVNEKGVRLTSEEITAGGSALRKLEGAGPLAAAVGISRNTIERALTHGSINQASRAVLVLWLTAHGYLPKPDPS